MARSGASQGGRKKKKKSTTTKRLTTTHYLKTALRDLTGGESMDNLQELMTIRDLIHADTAHGFSTTPYSIKVARAALYDDYKDWFKHSFPECIKQKLSCISKCLENPRPKHRFELKGLVDRLAAFLTFRVEFRPAHNETGKVKACTLRQWTSTLIDITMWHLYHKMGIKGDRLRDVMGGRKIDQGDGILKALERHTAFLIKDRRLSKQSDMDLDQDFGREEVGLMVDSLLSMAIDHKTEPEAAFASSACLLGGFQTGQRPGCFAASYPVGEIADEGLLCKHASLTRARIKGKAGQLVDAWSAHFDMDHLKGYNAPHKQFTRRWNLHPFERPENLAYEIAPYVIAILYYRGKLRPVGGQPFKTLEEFLSCRALRLEGIGDEPLFRNTSASDSPAMTVASLRSRLNHVAALNNLPFKSMSYLRRGFGKLQAAMIGRTDAVMLMGHLQKQNTFDRVYSGGPAQFDVARYMLGEVAPPAGAVDAHRVAQLRERAWMGFAMTSLCLANAEEGEERTTVAAAAAPLQAAPGATRHTHGRRTTVGTIDTTERYRKYDYVSEAEDKMKKSLKKVERATKVVIGFDSMMRKRLDDMKEAAEEDGGTVDPTVDRAINAHRLFRKAIERARSAENRLKDKARSTSTRSSRAAVTIDDVEVASATLRKRLEARRRVVQRAVREANTNSEAIEAAAAAVDSSASVGAAGSQAESLDDFDASFESLHAELTARDDASDDESDEDGVGEAEGEDVDDEDGSAEQQQLPAPWRDDDDGDDLDDDVYTEGRDDLIQARTLTDHGGSTAQDREETAIARVVQIKFLVGILEGHDKMTKWIKMTCDLGVCWLCPPGSGGCWMAGAVLQPNVSTPSSHYNSTDDDYLKWNAQRKRAARHHLKTKHPQAFFDLVLGRAVPEPALLNPLLPPSASSLVLRDESFAHHFAPARCPRPHALKDDDDDDVVYDDDDVEAAWEEVESSLAGIFAAPMPALFAPLEPEEADIALDVAASTLQGRGLEFGQQQSGHSFGATHNLAYSEYKVPKRAGKGKKYSIGDWAHAPGPILARGPEPFSDRKSLGRPSKHESETMEKELRGLIASQDVQKASKRKRS